jgi:hypothetical protein
VGAGFAGSEVWGGEALVVLLGRRDRSDYLAIDVRILLVGVQPDDILAWAAVEHVNLVVTGKRVEDVVSVASVLDV